MSLNSILLVDDEPEILKALVRLFKRARYQIFTAGSAVEALKTLQEYLEIKVVITDYRMPVMTGSQLVVEIKEHCPHIVSIMLSGYAECDAVIHALNKGAIHKYIMKPWDEAELLDAVADSMRIGIQGIQMKGHLGIEGLLSCKELLKCLDRWMVSSKLVTAFYLDVKRFHNINNSIGYDLADQVLSEIAHILLKHKPAQGVLGHIRGDEFVLLLPDSLGEDQNRQLINTMLQPFNTLLKIAGNEVKITFRSGYAVSPRDGETPEILIKNADAALDNSKQKDSGEPLRYRSSMHKRRRELNSLSNDLYHVLEMQQFTVVYQPKVCVTTGRIASAEALLRRKHPGLGSNLSLRG